MPRGLRLPSSMLPALRRWFTRHPAHWVLGVMLSLTLGGAQLVAACHEISHAFVQDRADAGTGLAAFAPVGGKAQPAAVSGHECPICLLAAALGGAATAPQGPMLPAADGLASAPHAVAISFVPRFAPAYASRAPPFASPAA
jgi:hypothetical protein